MKAHRRIVVSKDSAGRSLIVDDRRVAEAESSNGNRYVVLWGGDGDSVSPGASIQPPAMSLHPPPEGWRVVLLTFLPDTDRSSGRGMHATESIDVVLVISGELWLEVDDGTETRLTAGTTVVQNATRHRWRNRSAQPATVALLSVGPSRS